MLFFLMLGRFSDGGEKNYRDNFEKIVRTGLTPLFKDGNAGYIDRFA